MKKVKYLTLFLFVFAASCSKIDNFLDEAPSRTSGLQITTIDHLEQLLNNFSLYAAEGNPTALYSTDDFHISKALYDARPANFGINIIRYHNWDVSFLTENGTNLTDGSFWAREFQKIFYANTVLEYLDRVTGGTPEQKANLKAEAHLIRAYSYWVLANTYCLPYTDATKNEPGLPIRLTISFEEAAQRQPLYKVYEQIEADLTDASKINVPLVQGGKITSWRANKAAVNGFAARYWLSRFNYEKALQYANSALVEHSTLVDYKTEMSYSPITATFTLRPSNTSYTVKYPITHDYRMTNNTLTDPTGILQWKEFMYLRMLSESSWWYIPSSDLLALYDQTNDLRYRYHIVEGYSYDRGITNPSYDYPGYVFFFKSEVPSGPTVAEMLLIKAEALAHTGQSGPAMDALNTIRAKRMTAGSWVNLTAANNDDAMRKVTEERRREMPFAQRWFDLRRYNHNEYAGDDVNLTRTFYPYTSAGVSTTQPVQTYTLNKGSRRWAAPIPTTEIIASRGELQQNTY
ncbi:MAG TPA: RagB/SusD family nutrient uptake outer membrane protein [Chitinophagaceae bacterium]|nr:RagB/SusD family nutrient uptake outer membrane protein [Chitinophagaceae bacterium]